MLQFKEIKGRQNLQRTEILVQIYQTCESRLNTTNLNQFRCNNSATKPFHYHEVAKTNPTVLTNASPNH